MGLLVEIGRFDNDPEEPQFHSKMDTGDNIFHGKRIGYGVQKKYADVDSLCEEIKRLDAHFQKHGVKIKNKAILGFLILVKTSAKPNLLIKPYTEPLNEFQLADK